MLSVMGVGFRKPFCARAARRDGVMGERRVNGESLWKSIAKGSGIF